MIWKVRRVVTAHDQQGRSVIASDGIAPNLKEMAGMPGLGITDLWETGAAPASNEGTADAVVRPVHLEPPKNGTLLRIVEFPPDSAWRGKTDGGAGFDSIGAAHAQDKHSDDPMMHKTASVDYIIVLKGEIVAIVDTGEVLLKPGDVFIQRGTRHSWSVRGNEPCIIAVVLVSATPYGAKRKAAAPAKKAVKKSVDRKAPQKATKKTAKKAARPAKRKTTKRR
ncbi:MAG: cupin domain-containing protein [Burkholderiales bacterium]